MARPLTAIAVRNLDIPDWSREPDIDNTHLSPDGRWVAFFSDNEVIVRSLTREKSFPIAATNCSYFEGGFFGADEFWIGQPYRIVVYETTGWKIRRTIPLTTEDYELVVGRNRALVVSLRPDNLAPPVREINRDGKIIRTLPHGNYTYFGNDHVVDFDDHNVQYRFFAADGTVAWTKVMPLNCFPFGDDAVGFVDQDDRFVVYDIETGETLHEMRDSEIIPSYGKIATVSAGGRVAIRIPTSAIALSSGPWQPGGRFPLVPRSYPRRMQGCDENSVLMTFISNKHASHLRYEQFLVAVVVDDEIFVLTESSCWSKSIHPFLAPETRDRVKTMMLCAHRNRAAGGLLPSLPIEMWKTVLGFLDCSIRSGGRGR